MRYLSDFSGIIEFEKENCLDGETDSALVNIRENERAHDLVTCYCKSGDGVICRHAEDIEDRRIQFRRYRRE